MTNKKIIDEVLEVYKGILERIGGDFQNRADAQSAASMLTAAYFNVAAIQVEEKQVTNQVVNNYESKKGVLNGR